MSKQHALLRWSGWLVADLSQLALHARLVELHRGGSLRTHRELRHRLQGRLLVGLLTSISLACMQSLAVQQGVQNVLHDRAKGGRWMARAWQICPQGRVCFTLYPGGPQQLQKALQQFLPA